MRRLWSHGKWVRTLALFLVVVLALNTAAPAVRAEEGAPAEQTQEAQPETEQVRESAAEEDGESPLTEDPVQEEKAAEEAGQEAPAEEAEETEAAEPEETEAAVPEETAAEDPAEEPAEAEDPGDTEPESTEEEESTEEPPHGDDAMTIEPDHTFEAWIADPGEVPRCNFTPETTEYYYFIIASQTNQTGGAAPVMLRISDEKGNQLLYREGSEEIREFVALTAGTEYSVEVGFLEEGEAALTGVVFITAGQMKFVLNHENDELIRIRAGLTETLQMEMLTSGQPVHYLWSVNGEETAASSPTFIVAEAGSYSCRIYDDYGHEAVYRATVEVTPYWRIASYWQDPAGPMYPGNSVTMQVEVDFCGNEDLLELSYQWFVSYDDRETWSRIEGENEASCTITISAQADYWCQVMDQYNMSESRFFTLDVISFTAHAVQGAYNCYPGDTVTMEVEVTADDLTGFTYEWHDEYSDVIEGATGPSHTVTVDHSTYYECCVTDRNEHSIWVRFTINVRTLNIISTSPSHVLAENGDTVTLSVEAEAITGELHYAWQYYYEYEGGGEGPIATGDDADTLSFRAVYRKTGGYYRVQCTVTQDFCDETVWFTVRVYEKLSELTLDQDETANGGDSCSSFTFIPEETGYYVFTSYSSGDPQCHVYDTEEWVQIDYDDNSGDGSNFRTNTLLRAGRLYLFEVWSQGGMDEFPVRLTRADHYLWLDMDYEPVVEMEEPGQTVPLQVLLLTDSTDLNYRWRRANNTNDHEVFLDDVNGDVCEADRPGCYRCDINDNYGNQVYVIFHVRLVNMLLDASCDYDSGDYFCLAPGESARLQTVIRESNGQAVYYRWYRDDMLMEGETGSAVTVSLAGTYYCDVYDDYGNETTVWFAVEYESTVPLSILSTGPRFMMAEKGDTVTLTVDAASAYGDVQYSWTMYDEYSGEMVSLPAEGGTAVIHVDSAGAQTTLNVYCQVRDGYDSAEVEYLIRVFSTLTELVQDVEMPADGNGGSGFVFVPEETGVYVFSSASDGDPYTNLYELLDNSFNEINSADDDNGSDFIMKTKLTAGHTYVFGVGTCSETDDFTVILTRSEHYLWLDMNGYQEIWLDRNELAELQPILYTDSNDLTYEWLRMNNNGNNLTELNFYEAIYETDRPGMYIVNVRDEYGNHASATFVVHLSYMPLRADFDDSIGNSFEMQAGEKAELKVIITESAGQPVYFTWYRNGELMEDVTGDTYMAGLGGSFYCDVSDDYGNEVTVGFYVHFDVRFNVWRDQSYFIVNYGGKAELRVLYDTSGQELHFQWYLEEELIEENGTDVYLTNVGGSYKCRVSDEYGNVTDVYFYVNAVSAYDWYVEGYTSPNYSGQVDYGGTVTFEVVLCGVEDPGQFTAAWYKVPSFADYADPAKWVPFGNHSEKTLTLSNITEAVYLVCEITDPFGASSRTERFSAGVNNHLSLRAADDRTSFAAEVGESVTLEVNVFADDLEGLDVRWYSYAGEGVDWDPLEGNDLSLTVTKTGDETQNVICQVRDRFENEEEIWFEIHKQNHLTAEAVDPYRCVPRGTVVTLEVVCNADDTDDVIYTWYNDYGWVIAGGNDSTLITDVYYNCVYACSVTDRFGTTVWVYFELVTDMTWYLESSMLPEDGHVEYGEEVSISNTLNVIWYGTGDPEVAFRWFVSTEDTDDAEWTLLEGETGPSLTRTVTEHVFIRSEASDKFGTRLTETYEVFVENHLEIEGPEPELVSAGEDVTFEANVSADDTEDLQYVWYTLDEGHRAGRIILSTDGPSYTVENVTRCNEIYLDVTDKYGNTETALFTCSVENHFTAEAEEKDVRVRYHGDAELKVAASADNMEGMTFTWYGPYGDELDETGAVLTVYDITEDNGYYCRAEDCYGTVIRVDFTVSLNISWDAELQYQDTVLIGEIAEITVQLSGEYDPDELTFCWYQEYGPGYWECIWGEESGTLRMSIMYAEEYSFCCEITDGDGYTKTVNMTLRGDNNFSASFLKGGEENVAEYGGDVTVGFRIDGHYLDDVWFSWEKYYDLGDYGTYRDLEITEPEHTFTNVTGFGRYRFTVWDGHGSRAEFEFTVDALPADITYSLDKESAKLTIGSTENLKLTGSDGSIGMGTWASSDESVASVDSAGNVTAVNVGKAVITASVGNTAFSCEVTVLFKDVAGSPNKEDPDYQYFYTPVYWAAENGITKGYSDGTFGVGLDCQRKDLMIFLWRYAGEPTADKDGNPYGDARKLFNDMSAYKPSSAANKAVAWAYKEGITKGYNDGGFHPTDPIVRKDVMILLYRLAGKPNVSGTLSFPDCQKYKKTSDTYKAILWGSKNKITNGYTSGEYAGQFGVDLNCLREQIVTFLQRYDKLQ